MSGGIYRLLRPLVFLLDPERAHTLTFAALHALYRVPGFPALIRACYGARAAHLPTRVMGLDFPNPVGLAAGLDKNGENLESLADFGFGSIEIGTLTPRPQEGNPKKRLFRVVTHEAIINRMGFNNGGLERALANIARQAKPKILGINIGKNKGTPLEQAVDDYVAGLRTAYAAADYIAVNISSPNTPQLRALQAEDQLDRLLGALKAEQARLQQEHRRYVPIAVKVAPDLTIEEIRAISQRLLAHRIDGLIATNTTITRPGLGSLPLAREAGGLSGRPLRDLSTAVIASFYAELQGRIPIIGVGGIANGDDAWEKLVAGADMVQLYTGFIYEGPALIKRIINHLEQKVQQRGAPDLATALASARRNHLSEIHTKGLKNL